MAPILIVKFISGHRMAAAACRVYAIDLRAIFGICKTIDVIHD
jgi:hypothetical protein